MKLCKKRNTILISNISIVFCNSRSTFSWPECPRAPVLQEIMINLITLKLQTTTSAHWKNLPELWEQTLDKRLGKSQQSSVLTVAGTGADISSTKYHLSLKHELRNQNFSDHSGMLKNYSSAVLGWITLDICKYAPNNYLFQAINYAEISIHC